MSTSAAPAILIVEDERIVAMDLQQTLQGLGYDAYAVASSAEEAVATATARCPDLALMDIRIKGDRDGIETAAILRDRFLVPVVFLTAHADDATLSRAKATAPHGYLLKPVRVAELRSAIEVALYRNEIEKRLRERERWFSTTLRSIGDAVITVDLAGRITFMNEVAERLTGTALAAALGKPAEEVLQLQATGQPQPYGSPLERALRNRETVEMVEGAITGKGEGRRIIADRAAPVVDDGELLGAVMVFRDVTEERQMRQRLELSDRLASLGTMAAGVAHEVNNPLAVVTGNASFVAETVLGLQAKAATRELGKQELNDLLRDVAQAQAEILAAATRIQRIVADLKTFSRPELQARGEADIARAFEWARRATASDLLNRAQLEMQLTGTELYAGVDELRLGQVLVNLLINAAQAMPGRSPESNRVSLSARRLQGGEIAIEVADNGSGIPVDVLPKIFEPFFTTKPPGVGTGLGLSICHGIIQHAGGRIHAENQPGGGAVFRIVLPPALAPPAAPPPVEGPSPAGRYRVLVVDDEEAIRRVLSRMLREHDVSAAADGRAALDLIENGGDFDVIICDVMMPVMTGIELYERLLELRPQLARRMLFVSGGTTGRVGDFRRSVRNTFLDKPFAPSALYEVMRRVIKANAPDASPRH